jgi:hypothetical protein
MAATALVALAGCASTPGPEVAQPASGGLQPDPQTGYTRIVGGASDSVGWTFGSSEAGKYRYTFRQTGPAGGGNFTYRDRDLTFSFRPSTDALHFEVENLKEVPVWIDWDRSTFFDPISQSLVPLAHRDTRWADRFASQAPTQIPGFQRYGDYLFPKQSLLDPAGSTEQLRRRFLPVDDAAQHFVDREFGADLVFRIESRDVTYPIRFRVRSVVPQ